MIRRLLPTAGDWVALVVWAAAGATVAVLLMQGHLERRRRDRQLFALIDEFAELQRALDDQRRAAPYDGTFLGSTS